MIDSDIKNISSVLKDHLNFNIDTDDEKSRILTEFGQQVGTYDFKLKCGFDDVSNNKTLTAEVSLPDRRLDVTVSTTGSVLVQYRMDF